MSGQDQTRLLAAITLAALLTAIVWLFVPLDASARLALTVFLVAIIAWTMTSFDATAVALVAALTLVLGGTITPENFYRSLGHPLIWLLVGAFVISSALSEIRLADRLVRIALRPVRNVTGLFYALTIVISATAFLIPSTTGRAAFLLPVFMTLSSLIGNPAVTRAMSIHFPTVILLSACGSLIGAGAHLVAIDMIRELDREPGAYRPTMSFLEWTKLGLPFALVSSISATFVILRLFLNRDERTASLSTIEAAKPPKMTAHEVYILSVVAVTIVLWLTQSLHGIEITIITLCAAIAVTVASPSGKKIKDSFKSVDWNLLIFIAGASLIGEALIDTNAASDLVKSFVTVTGNAVERPLLVVTFVSLVALLSHLVITSRTARATAIIPLLAFPFAQLGYNGMALIFLTVVASGYCLTLTISAKSLLIYSNPSGSSFSHGELLRMSAVLLPLHLVLLIIFAVYVWPWLGLPLFASATAPVP